MPILNSNLMRGISDRLAKQVKLIEAGISSASIKGGGEGYQRLTTSEDYDVEQGLKKAYSWDKDLSGITIFADLAKLNDYLSAFSSHAIAQGASNFDDWLQTSGITVADSFGDVWYWVQNERLSGRNVFLTSVIDLARYQVVTSGTGSYSELDYLSNAGAGTYQNKVSLKDNNYDTAKEQLECYVPSGISIGSNNLVLDVHCKKETGIIDINTVTIPGSSLGGTVVSVGGNSYIRITNIALSSGSNDGDQVKVRNVPQRVISL